MRRMSEERKDKNGYGCGKGADYIPRVKVGEFGSLGTVSNPIDWTNGRTVHLLSQAEAIAWHIMRWSDHVVDIREQFPLELDVTLYIAEELGIQHPNHGNSPMTSDFLVTMVDHKKMVVSVKTDRFVIQNNRRTAEKLYLEKEYWSRKGVRYILAFKSEMNRTFAANIRNVVAFYDLRYVADDISLLKHLIAHKQIIVDMEKAPLNYRNLLNANKEAITQWKRQIHIAY